MPSWTCSLPVMPSSELDLSTCAVRSTTGRHEVAATVDPLGNWTSYSYDALNRPVTTTDALGHVATVVYDAVGKDTYPGSLDCLKPLGLWVSFGNASGAITNFDLLGLSAKGSLFATRPTLNTYVAKREDLLANANELFDVVSKGIVRISVNHTYPLKDAAQAHRDLEGRKTTGSIVLLP